MTDQTKLPLPDDIRIARMYHRWYDRRETLKRQRDKRKARAETTRIGDFA